MKAVSHVIGALLIAFALWTPPAWAADATDSFVVRATVLASCEVAAEDLDFGDYDPVHAAHLDVAGELSLTCTNGTPYELALSLGDGPGASAATRYMQQGVNTLAYALYRNAGRTLPWGENDGVDTLAGTGTGAPVTIDIYGRVPMQQAAPAGDYEDIIVVTVTW